MLIRIDSRCSDPLYLQIHDQIVAGIATGELSPGDALPSVRSLASDLGINLHTVNKAYAVLRDEGFVSMKGRAGARIAAPDNERHPAVQDAFDRTEAALFDLALAFRARGGSRESFLDVAKEQADKAFSATALGEEGK